jgi:hypothetical protein
MTVFYDDSKKSLFTIWFFLNIFDSPFNMRKLKAKYYLMLLLFVAGNVQYSKAQTGLCPSNLDFELGNFTNWACRTGSVDGAGNLILAPTPPIPGKHTIITAPGGVDPYGGFLSFVQMEATTA